MLGVETAFFVPQRPLRQHAGDSRVEEVEASCLLIMSLSH